MVVNVCVPLMSVVCAGRDMEVEACQRFFRDGLTLSFNRILTDDAVSTWKPDIQVLIHVCVHACICIH